MAQYFRGGPSGRANGRHGLVSSVCRGQTKISDLHEVEEGGGRRRRGGCSERQMYIMYEHVCIKNVHYTIYNMYTPPLV